VCFTGGDGDLRAAATRLENPKRPKPSRLQALFFFVAGRQPTGLPISHIGVSLSPTLSHESTGCSAIEGLWGTWIRCRTVCEGNPVVRAGGGSLLPCKRPNPRLPCPTPSGLSGSASRRAVLSDHLPGCVYPLRSDSLPRGSLRPFQSKWGDYWGEIGTNGHEWTGSGVP
jgi:hypothetical protein